jgi:hypothetical protein
MLKYLSKLKYNKNMCIRLFGLSYDKIMIINKEVESVLKISKPKQGRHKSLDSMQSVLLYLYYLKQYCSLEMLGLFFNISTSSAYRYVKYMTTVFDSLNCLNNLNISDESFLLVDGTETEIERPLTYNNFVDYYGRKKKFSIKTQVIVNPLNSKVTSINCCVGSIHDFKLFSSTYNFLSINPKTCIIADAGYIGIKKVHKNSFSILKNQTNLKLTTMDTTFNKCISNFRVKNEHVIGKLKNWKVFKGLFRHCNNILYTFFIYARVVSKLYNFSLE